MPRMVGLERREAPWHLRWFYSMMRKMFGKDLTPAKIQMKVPGIVWGAIGMEMALGRKRRVAVGVDAVRLAVRVARAAQDRTRHLEPPPPARRSSRIGPRRKPDTPAARPTAPEPPGAPVPRRSDSTGLIA